MRARLVVLVSLWLCTTLGVGHPLSVSPGALGRGRQASRQTDDVLAGEEFLSFVVNYADNKPVKYSDTKPRQQQQTFRSSPRLTSSSMASSLESSAEIGSLVPSSSSRLFGEKLGYKKRNFQATNLRPSKFEQNAPNKFNSLRNRDYVDRPVQSPSTQSYFTQSDIVPSSSIEQGPISSTSQPITEITTETTKAQLDLLTDLPDQSGVIATESDDSREELTIDKSSDSNSNSIRESNDEKSDKMQVVSVSVSSSVTKNIKQNQESEKLFESSEPRSADVQDTPTLTALQRSPLNIDESEEFVKLGTRQELLRITHHPSFISDRRPSSRTTESFQSQSEVSPSIKFTTTVPKPADQLNVHSSDENSSNLDFKKNKKQSLPELGSPSSRTSFQQKQSEAEAKNIQFAVQVPRSRGNLRQDFKLDASNSNSNRVNQFSSRDSPSNEEISYDSDQDSTHESQFLYDEGDQGESEKTSKSLLKPINDPSLPVIYSEPARVYSEPSKIYGQPSRVYSEPAKIYGEPAKVYGEPAKVYGEPAKIYGEPAKVYGEPAKIYGEPAKVYSEPSKVYREQIKKGESAPSGEGEKKSEGNQAGVLEGKDYKKYRVEEKTSDGFIVGEYGVLSHDGGSLRGVRYTADSDTNPSLIYDALVKFLALK